MAKGSYLQLCFLKVAFPTRNRVCLHSPSLREGQAEVVVKWTLLACLDSGNHPSPHKEVPQVSFPVKRTVVWPAPQGSRIALPPFLILRYLKGFSFVLGGSKHAFAINLKRVDNLLWVISKEERKDTWYQLPHQGSLQPATESFLKTLCCETMLK